MVVAARAALEAARDSEHADVLAWVQEAEERLNSAEEVSLPRLSSGVVWSVALRLAQQERCMINCELQRHTGQASDGQSVPM